MKSASGLIFLTVVLGIFAFDYGAQERPKFPDVLRVGYVEDHPWFILNTTCLADTDYTDTDCPNSCCYSYLVDLLEKCEDELTFNYTFIKYDIFGILDNSTSPSKWTGIKGAVINKEVHLGLVLFNVTESMKDVMDFTYPIHQSKSTNQTLALGLPKGSELTAAFSSLIHKLSNQGYLEQLKEVWIYKIQEDALKPEKQLTRFE